MANSLACVTVRFFLLSRVRALAWRLQSEPGTELFPGHEYSDALLPDYFSAYGSMQLPNHPKVRWATCNPGLRANQARARTSPASYDASLTTVSGP